MLKLVPVEDIERLEPAEPIEPGAPLGPVGPTDPVEVELSVTPVINNDKPTEDKPILPYNIR